MKEKPLGLQGEIRVCGSMPRNTKTSSWRARSLDIIITQAIKVLRKELCVIST